MKSVQPDSETNQIGQTVQKQAVYGHLHTNGSNIRTDPGLQASSCGCELYLIWTSQLLAIRHLSGFPEGKQMFELPEQLHPFSFWIEAEHGIWYAVSNGFTEIENADGIRTQKCPLPLSGQLIFVCGTKKIVLYIYPTMAHELITENYSLASLDTVRIGRNDETEIQLLNPLASRSHARIEKRQNDLKLIDLGSSFGTYLNGKRISSQFLQLGDRIEIPGVRIHVGIGFLSIQADPSVCRIRNLIRVSRASLSGLNTSVPALQSENLFFRRPRTRSFHFQEQKITFDSPPMPISSEQIPLALRIGGPAVFSGVSAMSGNYTSMISSVLFPLLTSKYTEKQKQEYEERRVRKYTAYLHQKLEEIHEIQSKELADLKDNNPSAEQLSQLAGRKHRLWERRPMDDDFLRLRIGTGFQALKSQISCPQKSFGMDEDPLMKKMYELAERDFSLPDAPIFADFFEEFICGFRGPKDQKDELFLALLFELCYLHAPEEVKVVILAEPKTLERFPTVRCLPHVWNSERDYRFIATNPAECSLLSSKLAEKIDQMAAKNLDRKGVLKKGPYYVVFSFSLPLLQAVSAFDTVLQEEKNIGFSILSFSDSLPDSCLQLFDLNSRHSKILQLRHQERPDIGFAPDPIEIGRLRNGLFQISNLNRPVSEQKAQLPGMLTFLEMFGVGKVEHLSILKRWKESNPMKTLAAPVGVNEDGSLFMLDLHEKYQGPHGLVAGMTGSGKSEFIITYILSMAVNYHPNEVSFILIDFKGGGLTGAFEDESRGIRLPHLAGTITNLDESTMSRALASIESELKRRQRVFNEAKSAVNEGTMDIYGYQQLYRSGLVSEPVSHLFIISDEFAELKSQQPAFMDQLISTARIGRSLGVHLILATQKPAGVVNEQIWSNSKFKVCLKVQDRTDSMEMIKRPEAAELKETGRFYLQVGYNEFFALGQSAWTGAPYEPADAVVKKPDHEIRFIDASGQSVFKTKPKEKKKDRGHPQLVAIMEYLTETARQQNLASRKLWLDPLPECIDWRLFHQQAESSLEEYQIYIGLADDPSRQQQHRLKLSLPEVKNILICGEAGSGKSTLVQSILLSLVQRHSPDQLHLYLLDLPGRFFGSLDNLRHVGGLFLRPEMEQITRMLDKILEILEQRKKQFIQMRQSRFDTVHKKTGLPWVLLVIDGFDEIPDDANGRKVQETLVRIAREGPAYGMSIILSAGGQKNMIMKLRSEIGLSLPLYFKESYQYYDLLGDRPKIRPENKPGRGLALHDGRILEFQGIQFGSLLPEEDRSEAVEQIVAELNSRYRNSSLPSRLLSLDRKQEYRSFLQGFKPDRLPVGIVHETIRPLAIPFQQLFLLSVYFGSREAVDPVIDAFGEAAAMNQADLICFGRRKGTLPGCRQFFSADDHGSEEFTSWLQSEIAQRTGIRKAICEELEIEDWKDNESRKIWRRKMRQKTKPVMIWIESFMDWIGWLKDDQTGLLQTVFDMAEGYNLYFLAGFYPDDTKKLSSKDEAFKPDAGTALSPRERNHRLQKYFQESPGLLFGGRFDSQNLYRLPRDYSRMNTVFERKNMNQVLLQSNGKTAKLLFPMGDLEINRMEDEDDLPIL